jgi:hypothetical protein
MMRILNRHTAYEALLTEHVDGVISAADDAKLSKHLVTCADCATDLREQMQVRTLLRAEPLVDIPRSFALPYAPRTADLSEPTGIAKLLRGMQVATAAAAMILVALVGLSVMDSPTSLTNNRTAASDASAPLAASIPESETQKTTADTQSPAGAEGAALEDQGSFSLTALPPADATLEYAISTEPSLDTGLTQGIDGALLEPDDTSALSRAPEASTAPEIAFAVDAAPTEDRPALEWALLASSAITALLALAVVAATWRTHRA